MNTRRLGLADASSLIALRREALELGPLAFAASPADDVALIAKSVDQFLKQPESQAVFGCFDDEQMAGMVGLFRESKIKRRHKATLWGLYVQPRARRRGAARSLLNAAIEQGCLWSVDQLQLSVTETAAAAKNLYDAFGFQVWGREPHALCWAGRYVDEYHLVLEISRRGQYEPKNMLQATYEDAPTSE